MIKDIVTDTVLLSFKCVECNLEDPLLSKEINHLINTAFYYRSKCAGLAFNQIGILKRGFVFKVFNLSNDNLSKDYKVIINPIYIMKSPTVKSRFESCLSRPNEKAIKKRRSVKIKIEYYDWEVKEIKKEKFVGFDARVIQHEIDHLNGILI